MYTDERQYWLLTIKNDDILAQYLPLQEDGPHTRVRNGSSTQSYTMVQGAAGALDVSEFIAGDRYILVVDPALDQPLIEHYITNVGSRDGKVFIEGATLEGLFENDNYVDSVRFEAGSDVVSDIAATIAMRYETMGVGMGLVANCPPSGVTRVKYYDKADRIGIAQALNDLGVVWNIRTRWADEDKSSVYKELYVRMPVQPGADPTCVFELDGPARSILKFDYAAPQTSGEYATRLTVVGTGTGDNRPRSLTLIDEFREQHAYCRDVILDVPELVTTDDCNIYAQQIKGQYFARRDAVTISVRETQSVSFADIHDMDAVPRVAIFDPSCMFAEVTHVGGWSVGASLSVFDPTLIKITEGRPRFPRSTNPAEDTTVKDIKDDIKRDKGIDKYKNGLEWGDANGAVKIGRDGLDIFDANGNRIGGIDSLGNGLGGSGGSVPGYVWLGEVISAPATSKAPVSVEIAGVGSQSCKNWSGPDTVLNPGDTVAVTKDGDTGDWAVLKLVAHRVDAMGSAEYLIKDTTSAAGFGSDVTLHVDAFGQIIVYTRRGVGQAILRPSAVPTGSYVFRGAQIYDGALFSWYRNPSNNELRVFKQIKGDVFWTEVVGVPTVTAAQFPHDLAQEPLGRPTLVTIARSGGITEAADGSKLTFTVNVQRANTKGLAWENAAYTMETSTAANRNMRGDIRFGYVTDGRHLFIEVSAEADTGTGFNGVYHIDLDTDEISLVQDEGYLLTTYLGSTETHPGLWGPLTGTQGGKKDARLLRVSPDGTITIGVEGAVRSRHLGAGAPVSVPLPNGYSGTSQVQRDGDSNVYYASASPYVASVSASRSVLWRIEGSTVTEVVPQYDAPLPPDLQSLASRHAYPFQSADGTISAVLFDPEVNVLAPLFFNKF